MCELYEEAHKPVSDLRIKLSVCEKQAISLEKELNDLRYRGYLTDNNVPQTPRHSVFEGAHESQINMTPKNNKGGARE